MIQSKFQSLINGDAVRGICGTPHCIREQFAREFIATYPDGVAVRYRGFVIYLTPYFSRSGKSWWLFSPQMPSPVAASLMGSQQYVDADRYAVRILIDDLLRCWLTVSKRVRVSQQWNTSQEILLRNADFTLLPDVG